MTKFFDKICQRKHFPSSLKLSFTKIGPLAKAKCVLLTKCDARTVSHRPSFLPLEIVPQARGASGNKFAGKKTRFHNLQYGPIK